MRSLLHVLILVSFVLLSSCHSSSQPMGDFKLLPMPEIADFYGDSELYPDSIKFYRLADGINLPVPLDYLKGLEETNKISGPQIVFQEDQSVVSEDEGYLLDIFKDRIFY